MSGGNDACGTTRKNGGCSGGGIDAPAANFGHATVDIDRPSSVRFVATRPSAASCSANTKAPPPPESV